ncbi:MAG: hypothetical protein VYA34_02625 [Myxococcota bacterium]|nr:hypothetical protein [Myxococcota bacterium]
MLAFEKQEESKSQLIDFFRRRQVTGAVVNTDVAFWETLNSDLKLGAIFLGGPFPDLKLLLDKIHERKREIPIFIRSSESQSQLISEFMLEQPGSVVVQYDAISDAQLTWIMGQYIFSRYYPNKLIQHVVRDLCDILAEQFSEVTPSINQILSSDDRRMHGDRIDHIHIKSSWCAGSILLETNTSDITNLVSLGRTHFAPTVEEASLCAESVIREIVNRLAGAFKRKYVSYDFNPNMDYPEVPMSISRDRHVSFGPAIPILCFDFGIRDGRDGANEFDPFQMYLRMSFHSHWDPEDAIVQQSVEQEGVNFF